MSTIKNIVGWPLFAAAFLLIAACSTEVKIDPGSDADSTAADTGAVGADAGGGPMGEDVDVGDDRGDDDAAGGNDGSNDGGSNTGGSNDGGSDTGGSNTGGSTSSTNIRVTSPRPGDEIVNPRFTLRGECRTFENTGAYRLRANNGTVLAEGFFTATGEMGTFSPYSTIVEMKRAYTGGAVLEVFQNSAKDGSEIDKVRIPLRIEVASASGTTNVSVFFTNTQKNPGAVDCGLVFAARRSIGSTSAIARTALEELLRGPTASERAGSFGTEIPSGTSLRDIVISNGVATADFSSRLNNIAGSCAVTAARAQIEQTLRQFPTVRRVVIAVEGRTAGVLQP